MNFFKKYQQEILFFSIGLFLGLFLMSFKITKQTIPLLNGQIPVVTINNDHITSDEYYTILKENTPISLLLDEIDRRILRNMYEISKEKEEEIEKDALNTIKTYTSYYEISEEEFYANNGFKNKKDFIEYVKLEYLRQEYEKDYLKERVTNNEINYYYLHEMPNDFEIMYLKGDDKTLNKILEELNNGKTYNDIIKKYKVTHQELGYIAFDDENINLDIYQDALNLSDNAYTKSLRSIDNEYYLIFRGKSKEKEDISNLKERIRTQIALEKINSDTNNSLLKKALVFLRKENNLSFYDTYLEELYKIDTKD